jgi:signal transduction histidine kinase
MKRPSLLTLVTAVLLVLLPAIAVLQYRWVGQVSEADRERMQTHVRNAAMQFREALDGEIARAVINLQIGVLTPRDGVADRYADRYDAWLATAAHPQLIANVFLVDANGPAVQLRRWDQTTHAFESSEWPDVLHQWRTQIEQELIAFRAGQPIERRMLTGVIDDSVVISPLRPWFTQAPQSREPSEAQVRPLFGFTVLQLDLNYIRTQLLPELAQRFFMPDGDNYRVAVTSGTTPATVIYRSDPDAPIDPSVADASEPLFGIRGDTFFFSRGGRAADGRRTVTLNIIRERGGEERGSLTGAGRPMRPMTRDFGRWLLLAQHRSGSLDAAVARTRTRNLGIGFGTLLLLSLSVGMLMLSSRRAQRLARQQMEFVAGVSHELRTPIAVIKSAAENLSQGLVEQPDRVKRYGDAIGVEARRLGEMVEQVMQYSELESGRGIAAHTAIAVPDLLADAIAEAAPIINAAAVHVDRHIGADLPPILGDAIALRSAVRNLLANAVKYGGPDHWVGVRADAVGTASGGEIRITVEDHGSGIPAADLPHIFEPFYRGAEAVSRQLHGNGLGLSIVKRIVAAHGGRIGVVTKAGERTAFTIVLPAADRAALGTLQGNPSPLTAMDDAEAHS